jgi:hypothetical protein
MGELEPVPDPFTPAPEPAPDCGVDPLPVPLPPLVGSTAVGVATPPASSVQPEAPTLTKKVKAEQIAAPRRMLWFLRRGYLSALARRNELPMRMS